METRESNPTPAVSVCMVTYNHAASIERAIESVLAQQCDFPFELVIGEDFSKDGTREIVIDYARRFPDRIRIAPHQRNVGAQQNEAITEKLCRGSYIAYCEGDDFWHDPTKLQTEYDILENNPDVGLVYSDYNRHYPKSGKTIVAFNRRNNNLPPKDITVEQVVRGGRFLYILTCTVMLRKALLEEVLEQDDYLFQRKETMIRDTSVWAEIAVRSKLAYIDRPLATYTVNVESASKSGSRQKQLTFAKEVSEIALHLARKHAFSSDSVRAFEKKWAQTCLRLALHSSSPDLSHKAWKTLRPLRPSPIDRLIWQSSRIPLLRPILARIDSSLRSRRRQS